MFNKQIYTKFRSKLFTAAHDKYLVWISAKLGYGNWARIREEIKKVPDFAFDHYFKSRTEGDLNKRMNSLIKVITNEIELEVHFTDLIYLDCISTKSPHFLSQKTTGTEINPNLRILVKRIQPMIRMDLF